MMNRRFLLLAACSLLFWGCKPVPERFFARSLGGPQASALLVVGETSGQAFLNAKTPLSSSPLQAVLIDDAQGPRVLAVLGLLDAHATAPRVLLIADAGQVQSDAPEYLLPLDALPPDTAGLCIARITDGKPTALSGQLSEGWYWGLRPAPNNAALPSLQRFASALVRVDENGELAGTWGELSANALLVPAPLPMLETRPTRILARAEGPFAEPAFIEGCQLAMQRAGLRSVLELVPSDTELSEAMVQRRAAAALYQQEGQVQLMLASSFLPVEAPDAWLGITPLTLLRQRLSLTPEASHAQVNELLLGLAALLEEPDAPLGAWLLERALEGGLSGTASSAGMRWRMAELYALLGHPELALETLSYGSDQSPAQQADWTRYRARVEHATAVHARLELGGTGQAPNPQEARDALRSQYAKAVNAYQELGFAPGSAETWTQYAALLESQRDWASAANAWSSAAAAYDDADGAALARSARLRAAFAKTLSLGLLAEPGGTGQAPNPQKVGGTGQAPNRQ
ncbi:MAG: hypothetical protein RBU37_16410, partial [Myxococcota bacterium]|nr:hypothetical protein [Myxococcota bacterium]